MPFVRDDVSSFAMKLRLFCEVQECSLYFMIGGLRCRYSPDDCHVQTTIEHVFMQSVTLFHESLDPVSYDTVSYFFTDRNTYSVMIQFISTHVKNQISVGKRLALSIAFFKIFVFLQ